MSDLGPLSSHLPRTCSPSHRRNYALVPKVQCTGLMFLHQLFSAGDASLTPLTSSCSSGWHLPLILQDFPLPCPRLGRRPPRAYPTFWTHLHLSVFVIIGLLPCFSEVGLLSMRSQSSFPVPVHFTHQWKHSQLHKLSESGLAVVFGAALTLIEKSAQEDVTCVRPGPPVSSAIM